MTDCNYTAIKDIPQPIRKKGSPRPLLKIEFLYLAVGKHGNKFDYSLVPQDGIRKIDKVKVICRTCGDIFNQIVKLHVVRGYGCPNCSGRKPRTTASFVVEAKAIHGDKYNYSFVRYVRKDEKVEIFCNTCNESFYQRPNEHIHSKCGCPKCGVASRALKRTHSSESFIEKAIEGHGKAYCYSKVDYVNALKKVTITCLKHGDFEIRPNCLLTGKGCAKCAREASVGFSRTRFERVCAEGGRSARLYIVRMKCGDEAFYKVGITSRSTEQRFNRRKTGYENAIIFEMEGSAGFIYDLEKRIHSLLSVHHYTPLISFGGSVKECFSVIPKPVSNLLASLKHSNQLNLLA